SLEKCDRGIVVDRLCEHRAYYAQLVRHCGSVRQQLAEPGTGLTVLFELKNRSGQRNRGLLRSHAGQPLAAAHLLGQLLAIEFVQERFVIEQFQMRRRAALEQINDSFGFWREIRKSGKCAGTLWCFGRKQTLRKQAGKANHAQTARGPAEELPARDEE